MYPDLVTTRHRDAKAVIEPLPVGFASQFFRPRSRR
jgi:hypothetical protein